MCGTKTVSVISSGSSACCTAVLSVALDGTKLRPLVIFRGKAAGGRISNEWQKEDSDFPSDCVYAVQEKAWMDERVMHIWIDQVWKLYCSAMRIPIFCLMSFLDTNALQFYTQSIFLEPMLILYLLNAQVRHKFLI